MPMFRKHPEGAILRVWVQPRSARNQIVGKHADALKIKLTAPPVEGAANKACIAFLAKSLGFPPTTLEIHTGHTSRQKEILIRIPSQCTAKSDWERLRQWVDEYDD